MDDLIKRLVRIEVIKSPVIPGRSGIKDGRAWSIPDKQVVALWQGGPFASRMEIPFPSADGPYRPGFYLLAGDCFKLASVNNRVSIQFDDREVQLVSLDAFVEAVGGKAGKVAAVS